MSTYISLCGCNIRKLAAGETEQALSRLGHVFTIFRLEKAPAESFRVTSARKRYFSSPYSAPEDGNKSPHLQLAVDYFLQHLATPNLFPRTSNIYT
jgi:hypothetical protein